MDIRIRKRFPKRIILLVLLLALKMYALNSMNAFDRTLESVKRNSPSGDDINQKVERYKGNGYDDKGFFGEVGELLESGTNFVETEEKRKYIKEERGDKTGIMEPEEQEKAIEREQVSEKEKDEKSANGTTENEEIVINKNGDYVHHENERKGNNLERGKESPMRNERVDSQKEDDNLIPHVIDFESDSLQKEKNVHISTYDENKEINNCERKEGKEVNEGNETGVECKSYSKEKNKKKEINGKNGSWEEGNDKKTTVHIENFINYNSEIIENPFLNEKKLNIYTNLDDAHSHKKFHDTVKKMDIGNQEEHVDNTKDDGIDEMLKYKRENRYNKENSLFFNSKNTELKTNVPNIIDNSHNESNINDGVFEMGVNGTFTPEKSEEFVEVKKDKEQVTERISSHNITDGDKGATKKGIYTEKLTEQESDTQQDTPSDLSNKIIPHDKEDNSDKDIVRGKNKAENYRIDLHKKKYKRDGTNSNEEESGFNVTSSDDEFKGKVLELFFTENANLYTNVKIGNQLLKIGLSSRLEGIYVFMKNSPSCYENVNMSEESEDYKKNYLQENNAIHDKEKKEIIKQLAEKNCYDPRVSKTARWCNNNSMCLPAILIKPYECYSEVNLYINNKVEYPSIYYDSLKFNDSHIEGSDHVELFITDKSGSFHLEAVENRERDAEQNTKNNKEEPGYVKTTKDDLSNNPNNDLNNNRNNDPSNNSNNDPSNSPNIDLSNDLNNDLSNNPHNDFNSNPIGNFNNDRNAAYEKTNTDKSNIDIMHVAETGVASKDSVTFESADIKLVVDMTLYKNWSTFKDVEGILGLAGGELSCRNKSVWNAVIEEHNFLFAVDINLPETFVKHFVKGGKESADLEEEKDGVFFVKVKKESDPNKSEIHIGDYKKDYGEIVWAEPRERGGIFSDSLLQFTIYNLEVCGQNIFGKYSSNWQGVVDLSSKCLILPKMFWLSLMEYLPINRNDKRCIPENKGDEYLDDVLPRMCSVDDSNRPLPLLKFVFSDNDIVDSNNINNSDVNMKEVHIPLDNLIIRGDKDNENYLCVIPDSKEGRHTERNGRTTKPLIKFGTYVLNNLYIVADQDNYRIGFAQKKSYHHSNDKCTQPMECIGDQYYEHALNMCIDPDCSVWYFYTLNEETKTCESLSIKFYLFMVFLVILVIVDIQSYCVYRKAVKIAKGSAR